MSAPSPMTKRDNLAIAAAMNALHEASDSLTSVPGTFEIRCLLDDEIVVQLRELLLAGVEDKWRERARRAI